MSEEPISLWRDLVATGLYRENTFRWLDGLTRAEILAQLPVSAGVTQLEIRAWLKLHEDEEARQLAVQRDLELSLREREVIAAEKSAEASRTSAREAKNSRRVAVAAAWISAVIAAIALFGLALGKG